MTDVLRWQDSGGTEVVAASDYDALAKVAAEALEWIERMDPMEAEASESNLRRILGSIHPIGV